MGEVNAKSLEKALAIMLRPWVYDGKETPLLSQLEIMDKIKEVYRLGYEDGQRQQDGDKILKQAQGQCPE